MGKALKDFVGAPCCMPGMFRIPGMSCMPPDCRGCWAWAVVDGMPHIIGLTVAVDPVVWAAA